MSFNSWLQKLKSMHGIGSGSRPLSRPQRCKPAARHRLTLEPLEDRCLLSTFTVLNTLDSGAGSFRAAITQVNNDTNPGIDKIKFAIGSGAQTIAPLTALPTTTHSVVIDGTSQPGFAGTPLIELDGEQTAGYYGTNGLTIAGGNSTVKGLVIDGFGYGDAILLQTKGHDTVSGNFLGTAVAGSKYILNANGVYLDNISDNTIGGTAAADRNIISGNGAGVVVVGNGIQEQHNVVAGNFIGTDVTGTQIQSNFEGVIIEGACGNTIGGASAAARNLITGNIDDGISLVAVGGAAPSHNRIEGNYIGTDATGAVVLSFYLGYGTNGNGIEISGSNNTVGGAEPGAGNLITGNSLCGILVDSGATGNLILGNYVGTYVTGASAPARDGANTIPSGVLVFGSGNTVGGTTKGAGNLISGNFGDALEIFGSGNLVQGNYIGTDVTGTQALGNGYNGIYLQDQGNTVGGTTSGARNVISGNNGSGVVLNGNQDVVEGNYIGTDVRGAKALANAGDGVDVTGNSDTVGGTTAAARNVISGNGFDGVWVGYGISNLILGNYIGTDKTGCQPLGNAGDGVDIAPLDSSFPPDTTTVAANTIAFNVSDGVFVDTGLGNAIQRNSIFSNGGLGIDLINGGNNSPAAPMLTTAVKADGSLTISGTLFGAANTTYTLEFFSNPAGTSQGKTFLGSFTVTTDATGTATFTATLHVHVRKGQVVTATATDALGDTSEFSSGVPVAWGKTLSGSDAECETVLQTVLAKRTV